MTERVMPGVTRGPSLERRRVGNGLAADVRLLPGDGLRVEPAMTT